jgi:hypothetical protein
VQTEPTIPVSNNIVDDVYAMKTVVTGSLESVFHEKRAPISILASLTTHRHETVFAPGLIIWRFSPAGPRSGRPQSQVDTPDFERRKNDWRRQQFQQ